MTNQKDTRTILKIEQSKEERKWIMRSALILGANLILLAFLTGHKQLFLPETYLTYANEYPRLTTLQIFLIGYPILRTILVKTKYAVLGGE